MLTWQTAMKVSIVIPCYQSGAWLPVLIERLCVALDGIEQSQSGDNHEVLLINDASPDSTWTVIRDLAERHSCVKGINLASRAGQFCATICGLERAGGDIVVTMDDDLEQRPEDVPLLVETLCRNQDVDCVIAGFREVRTSPIRKIGSFLKELVLTRLYGKAPHIPATTFRAMRKPLVEEICLKSSINPKINALIFENTTRIEGCQVEHYPRAGGKSGYSFSRLLLALIELILASPALRPQGIHLNRRSTLFRVHEAVGFEELADTSNAP